MHEKSTIDHLLHVMMFLICEWSLHAAVCKWSEVQGTWYWPWNERKALKEESVQLTLVFLPVKGLDRCHSYHSNYANWNFEIHPRGQPMLNLNCTYMATPPSQQKKRKAKKPGRAVSESPSITRLKGIGMVFSSAIKCMQGRLTTITIQVTRSGHPIPNAPNFLYPVGRWTAIQHWKASMMK